MTARAIEGAGEHFVPGESAQPRPDRVPLDVDVVRAKRRVAEEHDRLTTRPPVPEQTAPRVEGLSRAYSKASNEPQPRNDGASCEHEGNQASRRRAQGSGSGCARAGRPAGHMLREWLRSLHR